MQAQGVDGIVWVVVFGLDVHWLQPLLVCVVGVDDVYDVVINSVWLNADVGEVVVGSWC